MEEIIALFLCFLFIKYFFKVIRKSINFGLKLILILMLKYAYGIPLSVSIIFTFLFKYMIKYLKEKVNLSIRKYKKYRTETECLNLRKITRVLLECNYILFIINSFMLSSYIFLTYNLQYSFIFISKVFVVLIIVSLIKDIIDRIPEKYYM